MGLDVTAYSKVEFIRSWDPDDDYDGYDDGLSFLYSNPDFPGRDDGLSIGWYRTEGADDCFGASYGGYNVWCKYLAEMVGTTDRAIWANPEPGPFMELIDFADNEGVIGPATSAKLARDFGDWAERAVHFSQSIPEPEGLWFLKHYEGFARGFRLASTTGAVKFH